ncbi:MAG: hypothetical protein RLZZ522_1427 [Verrucomicrobiota bacterium]
MNRLLTYSLLLGLPGVLGAAAIEPRQDLLRFANGDQLHGSYQGIKDGLFVVWQREDLAAASEFKVAAIHKIILRGARPAKSNESLAHVALVNGDRIPGILTALDDKSVTVATTVAGVMKIPRDLVGAIAPAPLGGRVIYHGPFSEDGWLMINADYPDGIPPLDPAAAVAEEAPRKPAAQDGEEPEAQPAHEAEEAPAAAVEKPDPNKIPRWDFSGAAWYWSNKRGTTGLVRKSGMGDRALLRFNLAWRVRPMLSVAFHADFAKPPKPEPKDEDEVEDEGRKAAKALQLNRIGGAASVIALFGNSYVLQLNAGYAVLMRCGMDAEGNPTNERLQLNNAGNSGRWLPETGAAAFELRCDRNKGTISLFVDGVAAMEWAEPGAADEGGYAGKGGGFGFFTQVENTLVRISEVVVADWNGMPDSARSMQSDEQDIVLLANGTDRFSGKVTGLQDGTIRLHGKFGDFQLPLADIAELRFATNDLTKPEESTTKAVTVRFDPIGRVTGLPVSGDARRLKLATAAAGEIELDLASAIMLDFESTNNYLDDWDEPL